MKELIEVKQEIIISEDWNYNKSVVKCRNLFKEVREKGAEALTEFYTGYLVLAEDSKKKLDRKYPGKTFRGYCEDIGIDEQTGYEWLHRYFGLPRRILGKPSIPLLPEGNAPTFATV